MSDQQALANIRDMVKAWEDDESAGALQAVDTLVSIAEELENAGFTLVDDEEEEGIEQDCMICERTWVGPEIDEICPDCRRPINFAEMG